MAACLQCYEEADIGGALCSKCRSQNVAACKEMTDEAQEQWYREHDPRWLHNPAN